MLPAKFRLRSLVLQWSVGVFAVALLPGCGGSGQDQGRAAAQPVDASVAGVAVDGYLARAKVFIDTDNNGMRDAWEPSAFTDDDGYFSYNPKTKKDYCAARVDKSEAQFCLKVSRAYTSAVLRIYGGYDVLTQEPFLAQMSRRWDPSGAAKNYAVTPLTSLMTELSAADQEKLLKKLDITAEQLNTDYLSSDASADGAKLLNMALKLHKSVTVLSDAVVDKYPALGDESGLPSDASSSLYKELAQKILQHPGNLDEVLNDAVAISDVIKTVEQTVRAAHEQKEIPMLSAPAFVQSPQSTVQVVSSITNLTNVLMPPVNPNLTQIEFSSVQVVSRALEAVVISHVSQPAEQNTGSVTEVTGAQQLASYFSIPGNINSDNGRALVGCGNLSAFSSYSGVAVFLSGSGGVVSGLSALSSCGLTAASSSFLRPGLQLGGSQLRVSDLDLGQAPNQLKDMEFEIYFHAGSDGLRGDLTACAKYIRKGKSDGTLGKGDNPGELISGNWSLMGVQYDDSTVSLGVKNILQLVLVFNVAGASYSATMKPVGQETINGVVYEALMFNHLDKNGVWHSKEGVVPAGKIPTSTNECRARLPSRVGL
jgi:hypothetical protein